jgi:aminopeptidase
LRILGTNDLRHKLDPPKPTIVSTFRFLRYPFVRSANVSWHDRDGLFIFPCIMTDPRYTKLAKLLANYSCALKKGERILLDMIDVPDEFTVEMIRAVRAAGATPFVETRHSRVGREQLLGMTDAQAADVRDMEMFRMRKMQAYIAVRGADNMNENSDVPSERMKMYSKVMRPVLDFRVNKTRWCVLRWPTPGMAQAAGMSTDAFENMYFNVCTMDYPKMGRAMVALEKRMKKADHVHIMGPGTDLTFSIKGIGAKKCEGTRNIPDGEVFSCPTLKSANGVIQFNTPTLYSGTKFENIRLELKAGKVVNATSNNIKRLNEILDTDAGARYIGEFAIGFNPHIVNPMCDILFDEKIAGSLHFTPGNAYEDCGNGNKSAIHWDMVLIQRKEWGGGEIWFDGELIRKDGMFLPKDLKPLNPENLK